MKAIIKIVTLGLLFSFLCKFSVSAQEPIAATELTEEEIAQGVKALLQNPEFMEDLKKAEELAKVAQEAAEEAVETVDELEKEGVIDQIEEDAQKVQENMEEMSEEE